jgi:hypothetical protein
MTERDSFIWFDNDVELFIGGDDCYYELEINAFGTVYEAFFIWQDAHRKGGRFDTPQFDLYSREVDLLASFQDGRFGKHPRGRRWGFLDFDMPGLQTAVQVQGSINDNSQVDKGWTVELAIPWQSLSVYVKRAEWGTDGRQHIALRFFTIRGATAPWSTITPEPRLEPQSTPACMQFSTSPKL